MNHLSLTEIAQQMRRAALAAPGQPVRQSLRGGLYLTMLCRLPVRWQLSLSRPGVVPSPKEVDICRRFFDVPEHARRETVRQVVSDVRWYTVRLIWDEPQQLTLVEDESGPVAVVRTNYKED